jgi:hypothetical protein
MEICGDEAEISNKDSSVLVKVDGKEAQIDTISMQITCDDDLLHHLLTSVCQKLSHTLSAIV